MSDLSTALAQIRSRTPQYQLYGDYFRGRHRLAFASAKFRSTFGALFRAMAVNHCRSVVSALADRLQVDGFAPAGADLKERRAARQQGQAARDAGDDAWDIWTWNRMGQDAGAVHLEALREGDGYLIVWPNPEGQVTLYPQKAANMTVAYDPERPGKMLWAAKAWPARIEGRDHYRLNLYYPDRIEKYVTTNSTTDGYLPEKDGSFKPFEVEGEAWPLRHPWEQVPVFHFPNDAPMGQMGQSELEDVIPVQDALNKSVCDMLAGMEFVSLPQRWVTGLEVEVDEHGRAVQPFTPGVDTLWVAALPRDENGNPLPNTPQAAFGQFPQADLSQLLKVQDSFRTEIARISGTPLHYMMLLSDPPSGEALKTLEARAVKKARDRMEAWGPTWADALTLARRMEGQGDELLVTEWADPAPKSEREKAEGTQYLVNAGASLPAAAKVAGYTEAEVAELSRVDLVNALEQ